jgi:transcription initiation factor TFIIIB Brf1 subunit/transcription initiation factor TFIIB
MATLLHETLDLWREAERLLDDLPAVSADHETVAMLVTELRATYTRLSDADAASSAAIVSGLDTTASARELLEHVRERLARIHHSATRDRSG